MTLTNYENYQVFPILKGGIYSYSYNSFAETEKEKIYGLGNSVVLVAAVQGRNNARAIFTGSLDMFSNELYRKSKYANKKYLQFLLNWNFNKAGFLRVGKVHHHLQNKTEQSGEYKVMDKIEYSIEVEEFKPETQKWVPYITNDLIMEFIMLDPYIRQPLEKASGNNPLYKLAFQLPDKYGVFQFKVDYKKPGYAFILSSTKIPIRPLKHNEYERFLYLAYPYYFGVFGTLFAFVVFVVFFLFHKEDKKE